MVTKLKLKRERHSHPYWIAWLKNNHKFLVNEKCLVKFKIGSYRDELLYDIIPMEACYMLGRPW